MISAFPVTVSIAGDHHRRQLRIGRVNTDGRRQCPAVQSVEKIAMKVVGQFCRLTDARHQAYLMRRFFKLQHSALKRFEYLEIRAPGAPLAADIILKLIFFWH
jgi:hypothetical protein